MEIATITLLLGGHAGNTIQKYNVTAGEIAVLQLIHGNESVRDVAFAGEIQRSHRAEIERLHETYGARQADGRAFSKVVAQLFPGAAARVFETLAELELDGEFVKSLRPEAKPVKTADEPANEVDDLSKLTKTQLLQIAAERGIDVSENDKKADILKAIQSAPAPEAGDQEDEDEGVGDDMPDAGMFQ